MRRTAPGKAADHTSGTSIGTTSEDLIGARQAVLAGRRSARSFLESNLAAARAAPAAFLALRVADATAAADAADRAVADGRDPGPLAGLAVSVKDLFDIAGEPTPAASRVLAGASPATADAGAVARLRAAGGALVGRTHMSEFAFSGVGLNPHHPELANAGTLAVDAVPRIPGGSSSGAAASVASGAAFVGLGSDTGGSIRVPAALHGLVGFKSTAGLVPTDGAHPLSTTLDTACAITRSVRDAVAVHAVLAARPVAAATKPLASLRFAVPRTLMLDGMDATVARCFDRALAALSAAGATVESIDLPGLAELASLNATGGFSPAEAWALHRARLATDEARYDPRIVARIRRGEAMTAADYIDLLAGRKRWIAAMAPELAPWDALLSPTVPIVAPPIDAVRDDEAAFFAVNGLLLRNTSAINVLDGCAISIPCQHAGELPVGLMLWHGALHDDALLGAALAAEAVLAPRPAG